MSAAFSSTQYALSFLPLPYIQHVRLPLEPHLLYASATPDVGARRVRFSHKEVWRKPRPKSSKFPWSPNRIALHSSSLPTETLHLLLNRSINHNGSRTHNKKQQSSHQGRQERSLEERRALKRRSRQALFQQDQKRQHELVRKEAPGPSQRRAEEEQVCQLTRPSEQEEEEGLHCGGARHSRTERHHARRRHQAAEHEEGQELCRRQ
jgi:hypothetical protein